MRKIIYNFTLSILCCLFVSSAFAGEKVNQSIDLGGSRQATWYLPDTEASGWVLLQHGFQRNKGNLDDLATHLMDSGLMVLTVNANVTGGNKSLAINFADDLIDNPLVPPNNRDLPANLVIAGHSAGGLFASYLGGRLVEREFGALKGAILFDPVDKDNGMLPNLQSMLDHGKPVLSILANSSSCNSSNNAVSPLQALTDNFVGIKLTNNSKHTDVEGSSTGGIITWICGTPKDYNIAYIKDFGLNWANDMLMGSYSADYYPGGAVLQQLQSDNDGELIKALTTLPPSADFTFVADVLTVQFSNNSTNGDGNITDYQWDFGDEQSSTLEAPNHTYANAGTYTVTLTVTDDLGQSDVSSKNVTVVEDSSVPSANFIITKENLTVNFTDTSTDSDGDIISWDWSFGDGNSSNQANPTHSYASAGDYNVTLVVTDDDGLMASVTQLISVTSNNDGLENGEVINNLSAPRNEALFFTMNVPTDASNLTFEISNGTGDADIYVRYGTTPTTSDYDYRPYKNGNDETVTIAEPQAGVWHIMIRAYQAYSGVTLSASYLTLDNQAPSAAFGFTSNGLSVSFNDESNDADGTVTGWLWTFGDGAESNQANPTHTYFTPGTYSVTLAVTDNANATDLLTKAIEVSEDGSVTEIFNGQVIGALTAVKDGELHFVLKNIPPQTADMNFIIEGGTGDADIYVRYNAKPTLTQYDYRPYRSGNNETVNVPSPSAGDWYVMIQAYQSFSGVSLTANHTVN